MSSQICHSWRVFALLVAFAAMGGCAAGQTSGQPMVASDKAMVVFFVEHQSEDGRNLHDSIAKHLTDRGYTATAGAKGERPSDATHIVRYIDHWAWDMRMFLSDLRIEVRDKATGAILAYGQSVQNSLKAMGWTHDTVIDLALAEMLGEPPLNLVDE